jgi:hypothetical protein
MIESQLISTPAEDELFSFLGRYVVFFQWIESQVEEIT